MVVVAVEEERPPAKLPSQVYIQRVSPAKLSLQPIVFAMYGSTAAVVSSGSKKNNTWTRAGPTALFPGYRMRISAVTGLATLWGIDGKSLVYGVAERYGAQKFVGVWKQAPVVPGAWQLGSFVLQHFFPKAEDIGYGDDGRCVFCCNPLLKKNFKKHLFFTHLIELCVSCGRPKVRGERCPHTINGVWRECLRCCRMLCNDECCDCVCFS